MGKRRARTIEPFYRWNQDSLCTYCLNLNRAANWVVIFTWNSRCLQTVNEASTLSWGTRVKGFIGCFVVGAVCTILVGFSYNFQETICCCFSLGNKEWTGSDDVALLVRLDLRNAQDVHGDFVQTKAFMLWSPFCTCTSHWIYPSFATM